jgi:hypothetical protein
MTQAIYTILFTSAVWLVIVASNQAKATETTTTTFIGNWDAIRVGVDQSDQPHWFYHPDDPRLLGRDLVIASDRVRLNEGTAECKQPR